VTFIVRIIRCKSAVWRQSEFRQARTPPKGRHVRSNFGFPRTTRHRPEMVVDNDVIHGVLQFCSPLNYRPAEAISASTTPSAVHGDRAQTPASPYRSPETRDHPMTLCRAEVSQNHVGTRLQRDSQEPVVGPALQRRQFVCLGEQRLEAPLRFVVRSISNSSAV